MDDFNNSIRETMAFIDQLRVPSLKVRHFRVHQHGDMAAVEQRFDGINADGNFETEIFFVAIPEDLNSLKIRPNDSGDDFDNLDFVESRNHECFENLFGSDDADMKEKEEKAKRQLPEALKGLRDMGYIVDVTDNASSGRHIKVSLPPHMLDTLVDPDNTRDDPAMLTEINEPIEIDDAEDLIEAYYGSRFGMAAWHLRPCTERFGWEFTGTIRLDEYLFISTSLFHAADVTMDTTDPTAAIEMIRLLDLEKLTRGEINRTEYSACAQSYQDADITIDARWEYLKISLIKKPPVDAE